MIYNRSTNSQKRPTNSQKRPTYSQKRRLVSKYCMIYNAVYCMIYGHMIICIVWYTYEYVCITRMCVYGTCGMPCVPSTQHMIRCMICICVWYDVHDMWSYVLCRIHMYGMIYTTCEHMCCVIYICMAWFTSHMVSSNAQLASIVWCVCVVSTAIVCV